MNNVEEDEAAADVDEVDKDKEKDENKENDEDNEDMQIEEGADQSRISHL